MSSGRVKEQLRVTTCPVIIGEGEEFREMVTIFTSVELEWPLGSVLEVATISTEYVAPGLSPVILTLVAFLGAQTEPLCPPSFWQKYMM
jgi:hypothetical protein